MIERTFKSYYQMGFFLLPLSNSGITILPFMVTLVILLIVFQLMYTLPVVL